MHLQGILISDRYNIYFETVMSLGTVYSTRLNSN